MSHWPIGYHCPRALNGMDHSIPPACSLTWDRGDPKPIADPLRSYENHLPKGGSGLTPWLGTLPARQCWDDQGREGQSCPGSQELTWRDRARLSPLLWRPTFSPAQLSPGRGPSSHHSSPAAPKTYQSSHSTTCPFLRCHLQRGSPALHPAAWDPGSSNGG